MERGRTKRILQLFHLFYYCKEVSIEEITRGCSKDKSVSLKTYSRDIQLLKDAGLVQARYSKKDKAYIPLDANKGFVHSEGKYLTPKLPESRLQRLYMEKIIRLCTLMTQVIMCEVENPITWYRERYPDLSDRTRQRDFKQLREVGYSVLYEGADEEGPGVFWYNYPQGLLY